MKSNSLCCSRIAITTYHSSPSMYNSLGRVLPKATRHHSMPVQATSTQRHAEEQYLLSFDGVVVKIVAGTAYPETEDTKQHRQ